MFRRKTIFHAEEAMPDPEDIKLRFRRRVLLLTFLGFLTVLAIPEARELKADLEARAETRRLAERILETRTLAALTRQPVSIRLADDNHSWAREYHPAGTDCVGVASGARTEWKTDAVAWKLQVQKPGGETVSGRVLCLHPQAGLELDSLPIAEGKLLITASRTFDETSQKEAAYLFVSQYGADLQTLYESRQ
ncbi:MAG: hypothetical protein EOP11_03080 [Proteobacteria bacterium]|nr:MAG: hypothetical protein EOP11_03080 [Pseudomonadota bacterium]